MNFNPNLKIGLLGGGQLGRMLLQAAVDFDLNISVLDPDPAASCHQLTPNFVVGSFRNFDTVYQFGKSCDILTIEIESVNLDALKQLQAEGVRVFPQPEVIEIIQDKRTQKQFYQQHQLPTADFVLTENQADVTNYTDFLPAFHKLGKGGYDGRGVQRIASAADVHLAFDAPGLLEKAVDFEKEIAVIVARNTHGEMATFPTVEMVFHPEANLVEYLFAPAEIWGNIDNQAQQIAKQVAEHLGIVGLLAVEMFVTKDGKVLINEVAPRPHNSGHHTLRANDVSQFEQHLRAILGLPLGSTAAHCAAAMVNLLGEEGFTGPAYYEGMEQLLGIEGVHPFLYGKKITKPYRKMGHVTVIDKDVTALKQKVAQVKQQIRVIAE
ncbi:MAG: 5-(carboxyamino)imidazole ribonucleotide synthase [Spirosomataceae bacterium]